MSLLFIMISCSVSEDAWSLSSVENRYDLNKLQMSNIMRLSLLLDNDLSEYIVSSITKLLLLYKSMIFLFVHFLNANPGAITQFSGEYQNSSPVESIALITPPSFDGIAEKQHTANSLILNADIRIPS
jgi:hypothetical protein